MREALVLLVNGAERRVTVDPKSSLLEVLRDELDLTGTKFGCGEGQCGACTVLIDDRAVRSCRVAIASVGSGKVRTIEGLADGERLHPVQQAFLDETAMQCGYCTPAMIVSTVALLERDAAPTAERIMDALQGNLCRCGTYPRIVRAVMRAALSMRGAGR